MHSDRSGMSDVLGARVSWHDVCSRTMGGRDFTGERDLERPIARGRMRADFGSWFRDVVLSCRGFRRRPVFVFVAVASLALGIGGNALVFSVVDSVLLQPLSYPNADALVAVWLTPPNEPEQRFGTNTGVYFTIRDNNDSFESFGTGRLNEALTVTLPGDAAAHSIQSQLFSADMLSTMGVQPLLGDWPPKDPNGIAISHGLWQRQFGGSPNVLGSHRGSRCRHRSDRGGHAREFSSVESGYRHLAPPSRRRFAAGRRAVRIDSSRSSAV